MDRELTLFFGTFATLLAIINPFEVLPVYLKLLEGKNAATQRQVAWKSCVYALFLCLFFLIFGTLVMRLFGVPLAMVRIVGGIILVKIGFELFFTVLVRRNRCRRWHNARRKYCLCAPRDAADVRSRCNRDNHWNDVDHQAVLHRDRLICRRCGSHRRHHARDVLVPDVCGQAFG